MDGSAVAATAKGMREMDPTEIAAGMAGLGTLSEVSRRLAEVGAVWGFPNHAIGPLPTADRPVEDAPFMVENWPAEWARAYVAEGFGAFDPVPRAAETLTVPMTIAEIRQGAAGFRPDPRAERIFALSDRLGMTCGLLIPVFGPQNYRAMVCFAGPGPDPDPPTIAALRLVGLEGYEVDAVLKGHAIVVRNEDKPGVIGAIGTILGKHGVNVARLQVGLDEETGKALALWNVDSAVLPAVLDELRGLPNVSSVAYVTL